MITELKQHSDYQHKNSTVDLCNSRTGAGVVNVIKLKNKIAQWLNHGCSLAELVQGTMNIANANTEGAD